MTAKTWVVGSSEECDLVVDAQGVSGRHCRLTREENGRFLLEDMNSRNGTFVNGVRIERAERVAPGDSVTLGRITPLRWPADATDTPTVLTLGRDPENDVVIDLPVVSGRHARLRWDPKIGEAWVEDLGSSNGTSVGAPGLRMQRSRVLPHETLYLGSRPIPAAWLFKRLGLPATPEVRRSGTLIEDVPLPTPFHAAPTPLPTVEQAAPVEPISPLATATPHPDLSRRQPALVLLGQGLLVSLLVAGLLKAVGGDAASSAFALSLSAAWFGLLTAVFDGVLSPSWFAGIGTGPSVKRWAACALTCLAQSLLAWLFLKLIGVLSGPALPELGLIGLATLAALTLGMLIVAIARRPGHALAAAFLALAAMAFLARGSLAPQFLADASPTRWAYEGLLLTETGTPPAAPPSPRVPGVTQLHGTTACALSLGLMLVGFGAAAAFLSSGDPLSPQSTPFAHLLL